METIVLPETFLGFVKLLGSSTFIGLLLSILLTKAIWFNQLSSKVKFWLVGLICIGLPIISKLILLYLTEPIVQFIEFWWPTVVAGIGMWMSSQVWHIFFGTDGVIKKASYPISDKLPPKAIP